MKDFVTHEQALALKELGFDEPCFGYRESTFGKEKVIIEPSGLITNTNFSKIFGEIRFRLCTPTYSQAFRFFRKNHNMSHEIFKNEKAMIDYVASKGETHLPKYRFGYTDDSYHIIGTCMEYEEAESACLDFLIKLVKV